MVKAISLEKLDSLEIQLQSGKGLSGEDARVLFLAAKESLILRSGIKSFLDLANLEVQYNQDSEFSVCVDCRREPGQEHRESCEVRKLRELIVPDLERQSL